MKKAILYARCSTEEQNDKRHSLSYQMTQMKSHPLVKSYEVVGEYLDVISGTTFERKSLSKILYLCESISHYADYLFIEQWDRFGRNTEHHFHTVRMFKEQGVEVNAVFQMVDFDNSMWPQFLAMYASSSHAESIKISQRTKNGIQESLRKGYYTASPPVGYTRMDTGVRTPAGNVRRILAPDEKASIILELFESFFGGCDQSELREKYQTKLGVTRSSFCRIFTNVVYCGYIDCPAHKYLAPERVEAKHEPIVPLSLFNKVQEKLSELNQTNKGKTWSINNPNLDFFFLKGVLMCHNTYRSMTGFYGKGRHGGKYPYYRTIGGDKKQNINARYCHDLVFKAICCLQQDMGKVRMLIQDELSKIRHSVNGELKIVKTKMKKVKQRLATIENRFLDGDLESSAYARFDKKLNAELTELTELEYDTNGRLEFLEQFDWEEFKPLGYLRKHYSESTSYVKHKLLKALFPEGFSIDRGECIVQTPLLNSFLSINSSLSMEYTYIKIGHDQFFDACPVRGERRDLNPRPLEPQSSALTN